MTDNYNRKAAMAASSREALLTVTVGFQAMNAQLLLLLLLLLLATLTAPRPEVAAAERL